MNLVDSSAWLEYFAGGPNAGRFAPAIEDGDRLVVPTIVLYEVFKRILQQRDEEVAFRAFTAMKQGEVLELSGYQALEAATLSLELKLPMADSMILASARLVGATVWTQDADFQGLDGVRYYPKQAG